jgi:hypothetical protein
MLKFPRRGTKKPGGVASRGVGRSSNTVDDPIRIACFGHGGVG